MSYLGGFWTIYVGSSFHCELHWTQIKIYRVFSCLFPTEYSVLMHIDALCVLEHCSVSPKSSKTLTKLNRLLYESLISFGSFCDVIHQSLCGDQNRHPSRGADPVSFDELRFFVTTFHNAPVRAAPFKYFTAYLRCR